MIVWGGDGGFGTSRLYTGGVYDPATDTWLPTSTTNGPFDRSDHTAVWTGSKMIVWSGFTISGDVNTGGVYDPATDTWVPTSTTNAPSSRFDPTAVWTGTKMIVWGGAKNPWPYGVVNTGGVYTP
jgi:N-acetylneuraminic acid mutarotase